MSNKDFYATLGVAKDATPEQIKKAYRKLAMKWHPDRNPHDKDKAEAKFKEIGEAYSVLSDEKKRKNYDQFGTEKPQFQGFSNNDHDNYQQSNFTSNNAEKIFQQFFFNFGGGQNTSNLGDFGGFNGFNGGARGKYKGDTIQYNLSLTLEELYFGRQKNIKITRNRLNSDHKTLRTESKMISIDIKKGWKAGTKITFEGEGDENINMAPGDIQFVIQEKQHNIFERKGNDLVKTVNITLKQALCGVNVNVVTLDKRRLKVPVTENTICPGYIHRVKNEGMPISKTGGVQRGDLLIKFNIAFPQKLSDEQKETIQRCL